jgi:ribosomal-protein-alanine N-acetyltransferase
VSSPHHEYPRGPRLALREFRADDLLAWQRIAGDPLVAAHTPWPALTTPDTVGAWLAETARMAQALPRRSFYLAVEYGDYGDLVGTATLDILSLAFSRLELHRVQATFDPRNLAGLRVAEHVKMRPEGVLLDRYLIAGQWQDRAMYAITLPEWRGLGRQPNVVFEGVAEEPLIGGPRTEDPVAVEEAAPVRQPPTRPQPAEPPSPVEQPSPTEEPQIGEPVTAGSDEPLVGDTLSSEELFGENLFRDMKPPGTAGATSAAGNAYEPRMLTAQIVTRQIEVVEILPREP